MDKTEFTNSKDEVNYDQEEIKNKSFDENQ
jgi:hypothetical protein